MSLFEPTRADESRARLYDLPILRFLPAEVRDLVVGSFEPASFPFGSPIVREGDPADGFYVLVSGRARVIKTADDGQEISLNMLRAGDSFGEMGLLERTTRAATVRASTDVEVFRLDHSVFDALIKRSPDIRTYFELHIRHRSLHNFFQLYSPFAQLPTEALATLLDSLEPVTAAKGDQIIRQGEPPGPFFIVEEGQLRAFVEADARRRNIAYLRKGDVFGEVSMFRGIPRQATVEAVSDCRLLRLSEEPFRLLLAENAAFRAQIEQRISQYDYERVARVPLDFAEELLPAQIDAHEQVGPEQADQIVEDEETLPINDDGGAFASPEGYFVKKAGRIRRFPHVRQIDAADCGAACVAMVCRYFGRAVSLARIRQLLHTSTDGTSLRAICHGAQELGLAARSVKVSPSNLRALPLPAIVHWEGNHWVVLYDIGDEVARVADPATGLRRVTRGEFDEKWTGYAALFDYTPRLQDVPEARSGVRWLAGFFKPFSKILLQALALAVVVSALQLVIPIFTQVIVDRVVVDGDASLLNVLVVALVGVLLFTTAALTVQRYLLSFAAVRIDSATLDFLTRKLLALPMGYFHTRRTGDIQNRLAGMREIRAFVVNHGIDALTSVTQLAASLVLMFVYSSVLGAVFLVTAPLYAALMYVSSRWLRPTFINLEDAFAKYSSHQIDAIKGIETVKALGAEAGLRQLMLGQFHGLARRQFRADFTMMSYKGAVQTVSLLSTAGFLWVGAHQVMGGKLTIGALVAFSSLVAIANGSILDLLAMWDDAQHNSVLLDRLNDVLEQEPEQGSDRSRLIPVRSLEGRVRFENVGFRYGGPDAPSILNGISFEVLPGKMIAIVGRSGSGKTTLIKCLSGLLEPTEGTIFYDGIDLKTVNYRDLRRQIGFVLQENYLFDDTIARNIAFGEEEPDMDCVLWAARVANAHEFVERLPLGYETPIGESGLALSGGQRQRVAIARALYFRPPVLVFDEATSALDTEAERAVKENLDQLLEGRTSFVIAHRLSTIRHADHIVVLEKGRVAEQGNHEELMARRGLYYYLCSQQLEL